MMESIRFVRVHATYISSLQGGEVWEASPWNCLHHASLDSVRFRKAKEGHFWRSTIYSIICHVWYPHCRYRFFLNLFDKMRQNCDIRACGTYQFWGRQCQRMTVWPYLYPLFSPSHHRQGCNKIHPTHLAHEIVPKQTGCEALGTTKCFGFAGKRVWRYSKAQKGRSWVTGP